MKVKTCEFIKSVPNIKALEETDKLELVLIGKSNVGKSSFINALTNRKALARISSTPGKTRLANYFLINDSFYLVDMPGYGYAKVSKTLKEGFDKIITDYLKFRKGDFLVFFLLDSRHLPTENDKKMFEKIVSDGIYPIIILTKKDKLTKNEQHKNLKLIRKELNLDEDYQMFLTSAQTKDGIEEILSFIEEILADL